MSTEPNPSLDISNDQVNNRFEAHIGGKTAFLVYRRMPGKLVLVHTEVPTAFAGHAIGNKLERTGIEYAREQGSRWFRCARSPLTTSGGTRNMRTWFIRIIELALQRGRDRHLLLWPSCNFPARGPGAPVAGAGLAIEISGKRGTQEHNRTREDRPGRG